MNDDLGNAPTAAVSDQTVTAQSEAGGDTTIAGHGAARVGEPSAPTSIGRYRVLRRLGAGGMGVVYAAHDPELGRTVAIKLVHERFGGSASLQERLKREAQALARLHHPNVVSVHDVGVADERLYIVMQYVDGVVLDDWIEKKKAGEAGIVQLFLQAGRGLAAAHAAGLVHRDFKPGNVLVEEDGTARVTDFGLARASHLAEVPVGESDDLAGTMTSDDVVGTPAYMAPEQFLGGAITGAADQFGYCVSLWEALTGKRPFSGQTFAQIRHAVVTGEVAAPARPLPRRIQRALRRGLSVRAADRFPDMGALLDELTPPRRWWIGGVAAVGLAGAGAVAATMLGAKAPSNPCKGVDAPADQVWTAAARGKLHDAIAGVGGPDSSAMADAAVTLLDDRIASWKTMRADVCEASKVRHTDDDTVRAQREACLDSSLESVRSTLALLTAPAASPKDLSNAMTIVRRGNAPVDCNSQGAQAKPWVADISPALQGQLQTFQDHDSVKDNAYVIANGPALATDLEAAGDIEDAASVWFRISLTGSSLPPKVTREDARKAATLATQVGDEDLVARAWAIAAQRSIAGDEPDSVDDYLTMADAAAAKSPELKTRLFVQTTRGYVQKSRGLYQEAEKTCQDAFDQATRVYGAESSDADGPLGCLYNVYYFQNDWPNALRVARQRLTLREQTDGKSSADYIDAVEKLALATFWSGDKDAGRKQMAWVFEIQSRIYGPQSVTVMESYFDLALAESEDGALGTPEALAAIEHAASIARGTLAPDDMARAQVLVMLGNILVAANRNDEAMAPTEEGMAIYERQKNMHDWAPIAYNTADTYRNAGRCDKAEPLLQKLVDLSESGDVTKNIGATSRGGLGTCLGWNGDVVNGERMLHDAITELDKEKSIEFGAQFRLELAAIEWVNKQRPDAVALAKEVLAMLPVDDDGVHQMLRRIAQDSFVKPKPGKAGKLE